MTPKIMRHFKGGLYLVLAHVHNADTNQQMILYQSLSDGKLCVRNAEEFKDNVSARRDNITKQVHRFELVEYI